MKLTRRDILAMVLGGAILLLSLQISTEIRRAKRQGFGQVSDGRGLDGSAESRRPDRSVRL